MADPFATPAAPKPEGEISFNELQKLAAKHGAGLENLVDYVQIRGLQVTDKPGAGELQKAYEGARSIGSSLAAGVFQGIPAEAYRKFQDEPTNKAIDDLQEMLQERQSTGQAVAETVGSIGSGMLGGGAVLKAGQAAKAAPSTIIAAESVLAALEGGAYFGSRARREDQMSQALFGAGLGAGLTASFGFGLQALKPHVRALVRKKDIADEQLAKRVFEGDLGPETVNMAQKAYKENEAFEKTIEDALLSEDPSAFIKKKVSRELMKGREDVWKIAEQRIEKQYAARMEAYAKKGKKAKRKPSKRKITEENVHEIAGDHLRGEVRRLAKRVTGIRDGKKAVRKFQEEFVGHGEENVRQAIRAVREADYQADAIKMLGIKAPQENNRNWLFRFFADQTWLLREMEDVTGLPLVKMSHELSDANRAVTNYVATVREDGNWLHYTAKKMGVDHDRIVDLVEGAVPPEKMTLQEKTLVGSWQRVWERLRKNANAAGLKIPDEGPGYMKRQLKGRRELAIALDRKERAIQKQFYKGGGGEELEKEFGEDIIRFLEKRTEVDEVADAVATPKEKAIAEYVNGLDAIYRRPLQSTDDVHAVRAKVYKMDDPIPANFKLQVSPAIERTALEMPAWVRETDPYKLLDSWAQQIGRAQYMHLPLSRLSATADTLRVSGFVKEAEYFDNLMADMMGTARRGEKQSIAYTSGKLVEKFKIENALKAERAETRVGQLYWGTMSQVPEFMTFMQQQLYPYYMGLRVDNVFRNLTQPYTMTASLVGMDNVFSAQKKVVEDFAKGLDPMAAIKNRRFADFFTYSPTKFLQGKDAVSGYQQFEAIGWAQDGLLSAFHPQNKVRKVIDGLNNTAMYLYTKSDTINRMVTWNAAGNWAKKAVDPETGAKYAARALADMPASYARPLRKAVVERNEELAHDLMARYSLATTQFNYDRISMNEYGRFMGGMFSMFTKWPASIGGEIAYRARKEGWRGIGPKDRAMFMKYYGPLVAFGMMSGTLKMMEADGAFKRKVLGADMSGWAPVMSLMPRGGSAGELLSSPAIDLGFGMAGNLADIMTDPENAADKLQTVFLKQGAAFVPTATWFDFVFKETDEWADALDL